MSVAGPPGPLEPGRFTLVGDVEARNRGYFSDRGIVATYEAEEGLTAPERELVDRFVAPGARVLDLGVGTGRTTEVLSRRASTYIGLDYAPEMVASCRAHYSDLEFVEGDAADLSRFDDGTFDTVVFSFNGLDCLHPIQQRARCLAEIHRVLAPGGTVILSSHNVHALVRPIPAGPGLGGRAVRVAKQGYAAVRIFGRTLRRGAILGGAGYVQDSATPLTLYMCSRRRFVEEAHAAGFRVEAILGSDHPAPPSTLQSAWFYYALRRR